MAEQQRDLDDYRAASKADSARLREEFAAQLGQREARHADDLGLVSLNVHDDVGRDTMRRYWEAQPKAARGESAAKWWGGVVEAHKAAAEKGGEGAPQLPPALAAYLPKVEVKQPQQPGQPAKTTPRQPWAGAASDQGVASRQAPLQGLDAVLATRPKSGADFLAQLAAVERPGRG